MADNSSENLNFTLQTPLGPDVLTVSGFSGKEEISSLYDYSIQAFSTDPEIKFDSFVGQHASLSIALPDGSKRFISGHVSRFTQLSEGTDLSNYKIDLVPWLWFLTQRSNCRIFQMKTVPEIIKQIFDTAGFSKNYEYQLSGSYKPKEYCVQYRETDFNFVSRIMEEEGIFFFFRHEEKQHIMVLGDTPRCL